MTTIAANLKQISSDTFVHNQVAGYRTSKLLRVSNGIVAVCGASYLCAQFLQWCARGNPQTVQRRDNDHFEALFLTHSGLYVYYDSLDGEHVDAQYHAIGSGRQYALGALYGGASTQRAVECASQFDPFTKQPVETLKL